MTATIGPEGGIVSSGDGALTLEIPRGALTADTELGIEPITNTAPLGLGSAYELTPDGATFEKPVRLTFEVTADELKGSSEEALALAFQDAEGHWRRFGEPVVDAESQTVSAETTHFTAFGRVLGWQLVPSEARVSPLDSVELSLKYCEPETIHDPNGGDDLLGPIPRCDLEDPELPPLVTVNGWAVNGVSGGSFTDGYVSERGRFASYQAPGTAPAQNPVAVSCEFNRARGTNFAIANITVGEPGWTGRVSWTGGGTFSETQTQTDSGVTVVTTDEWDVTGRGTIQVRPGPTGTGEVESASASFSYEHVQHIEIDGVDSSGCHHDGLAILTETWSGTATTGAYVSIAEIVPGAGVTLAFSAPAGPADGRLVYDQTETLTGPDCVSPDPAHTDEPITGAMGGGDGFVIMLGPETSDRLQGTVTQLLEGKPPREYTIEYDLSR